MPYIPLEDRPHYQDALKEIASKIPDDHTKRSGHMNYVISRLISLVYGKELKYWQYNEIMGFLSGIDKEFYRRYAAPYEDKKIDSCGDLDDLPIT